jgi:hypothetical protein
VVVVRVSQKRIRALGSANAKPGCSQQNTVSTAHPTILKIFQKSLMISEINLSVNKPHKARICGVDVPPALVRGGRSRTQRRKTESFTNDLGLL